MPKFDLPIGTWELKGGYVANLLVTDMRLTLQQACGPVGNAGFECKEFTVLQEIKPIIYGSRGGYGWMMWTGPRRMAFEDFCRRRAMSISDHAANYAFLVHELSTTYRNVLAKLRKCETVGEATHLIHAEYERSSDVSDGSFSSGRARLIYAQRAYAGAQQFNNPPPDPAPKPILIATILDRTMTAFLATTFAMQHALADAHLYDGKIDGSIGPRTLAAIAEYRKSKRI